MQRRGLMKRDLMKRNRQPVLIEQVDVSRIRNQLDGFALLDAGGFNVVPDNRWRVRPVAKMDVHAASEPFDELRLEPQPNITISCVPMFWPHAKRDGLTGQLPA
jgi:hypothetical protein